MHQGIREVAHQKKFPKRIPPLPDILHRVSQDRGFNESQYFLWLFYFEGGTVWEQAGRVWKWVILICLVSKPFLTCLRQFFLCINGFGLFLPPTLTWSPIPLLFSPFLKIERKHAGNGSFDSKGSWSWWWKGDVEACFRSRVFSFRPVFVERVEKGDSTSTLNTSK